MEVKVINIDNNPFLQELYSRVEYEAIGGTNESKAEEKIAKQYLSATKT